MADDFTAEVLARAVSPLSPEEVSAARPDKQCPAQCTTMRGRRASTVFCTEMGGHEGLHRGFRKRWSGSGIAGVTATVVKAPTKEQQS